MNVTVDYRVSDGAAVARTVISATAVRWKTDGLTTGCLIVDKGPAEDDSRPWIAFTDQVIALEVTA